MLELTGATHMNRKGENGMLDLNSQKKNQVNLSDYDYEIDIKNRITLSKLTDLEYDVIEEILFNSIRFPISEISRNLELRMDSVNEILEKLKETQLFTIDGEHLVVNKDMRKYFDLQIMRFDEDFEPGMDFLQQLLKNIPIHILPKWYHIPRTSDNIFNSLVEKYLFTPHLFQRYLFELNFNNSELDAIVKDLYSTSNLEIPIFQIKEKFNLDDFQLQEYILFLEYNFIGSLKYEKTDDGWTGVLTPFKEWKEFLNFKHSTSPSSIESDVSSFREEEYAFSEDMAKLLKATKIKPISVYYCKEVDGWKVDSEHLRFIADALHNFDVAHEKSLLESYLTSLIEKITTLHLGFIRNNYLVANEDSTDWLNLPSEKRALQTYKHPYNKPGAKFSSKIATDKNIREIEKSLSRAANLNWVYLDEFTKGLLIPLNEDSKVTLQKTGKNWRYQLPQYKEEELNFIKSIIMNWLFESGMIQTGLHNGKPCFRVTKLGKILFGE